MKRTIFLVCAAACLLVFLMPVVSAACPGQIVPVTEETYYPPGPYGSITVESSPPGAIITVNGENQGRAPVLISNLWPGSYTITAKMNGYQTYTSITTISGPTHSAVYCPLVPQNATSGLSVTSSPDDAKVYLDGAYRGTTPLTLCNPSVGTHIIQIRLDGYKEWKSTVEIESWGVQTVSATLVPDSSGTTATINVSSVPAGAAVKLDGNAKGVTPITLKELAPGIHIVQLTLAGYGEWKSTVDIPKGETKNLNVTLVPKSASETGYITVTSIPGGALVKLDGNPAGRIPANSSLKLSSLAPGDHTIALELPGYLPYSTRTSVVPGKISEVSAILVPAGKGTLVISSNPPGADVFVDNASAGISPATVNDVEEGNHRVTLKREGYEEYSAGTLVFAGNTSRISADLLPQTTKAPYSPPAISTAMAALLITGFVVLRRYR
jgi:PEGA domain